MERDTYKSDLSKRYASKEMQSIFSDNKKFGTWRQLWIYLAEIEKVLGVNITELQISQLKEFKDLINYDTANDYEKKIKHDVMAHVQAYGDQCPDAKPIIHLGATSCYVTDNADIIIMKEALLLIRKKLLTVINNLASFAMEYKDMPTLAYTHFQPAQPTTVGKRACLWLQDLVTHLRDLDYIIDGMRLLGSKGTTGTQASFLELFENHELVRQMDTMLAEKCGLKECYPISAQTYPRIEDVRILDVLSRIAVSANKFGNDLRLLQSNKEMEEPFAKDQVGSSAMAYKRNPMRSERICAIARYVKNEAINASDTAAVQWLERTLDDSANRRLCIPSTFLALDGILDLYNNVTQGLVVYPKIIEKRLREELPFMITENILMDGVKKGGDRQELHEIIRKLSMQATIRIKQEGKDNNLLELIAAEPAFNMTLEDLQSIMDPTKYIGRAPEQVEEYIEEYVAPILEKNKQDIITKKMELQI